ncbi:ankyrin repeat-containing domain protein [Colletotrichum navitas]|uniref:Ankyrin repeat-containing domain protein n=1 Tax=Colletotrichum navitas TaxID=681940 RepID=A0AAD8QDY2_9PEZI|nr:ankyrin repeat-containing domain protein [Colletotrichum navitas]KAK1600670.1 ankyrin repeat-containing domain protein [Colletotrichum navitas]
MEFIGAITSVIDLFVVVHQIQGLCDRYRNTPRAVRDIIDECEWTKALCFSLKDQLLRTPDALQHGGKTMSPPGAQQKTPGHTLLWCFEKSMQGIRETLEELEEEATKLQSKKNSLMGKWDKTKFLWKEDFFKDAVQNVKDQRDMVAIVMSGIQLHNTNAIGNDLQRLIAMLETGQTPVSKSEPPVDQLQPPPQAIKKSKSDTQIKKSGTRLAKDLYTAVRSGRLVDVEPILSQGVSVDVTLGDGGDRAVHIAAREGFLPILDRLLAYGADVDIQNVWQETPLHQALQRGQTPTSLTLLSNGASWTITNDKGVTALHSAAKNSTYLLVQYLLDRGADPNVRDKQGQTPLFMACHPVDKNGKKSKVDVKVIRALMEQGADPIIIGAKKSGSTPVHELAMSGNAEELEIVAKAAKSVNLPLVGDCEGATPLHLAVRNNHPEAVDVLIRLGANVDAVQTSKDGAVPTSLWQAGWNKNLDIAAKLLEAGADPNSRGKDKATVLHLAVTRHWPEMVRLLARHNADLNAQVADKRRPLHAAVLQKDLSMLRLLLELGARVDSKGAHSATALMEAAQYGLLPMILLLIEHGADWSYTTPQGSDAFLWACSGGHVRSASFLLGRGRDLHKMASGDYTALHYAARTGRLACAKWLLELGIDKSIRSTTARALFKAKGTAAEVARAHGAVDVAEFIEKYEAEAAY